MERSSWRKGSPPEEVALKQITVQEGAGKRWEALAFDSAVCVFEGRRALCTSWWNAKGPPVGTVASDTRHSQQRGLGERASSPAEARGSVGEGRGPRPWGWAPSLTPGGWGAKGLSAHQGGPCEGRQLGRRRLCLFNPGAPHGRAPRPPQGFAAPTRLPLSRAGRGLRLCIAKAFPASPGRPGLTAPRQTPSHPTAALCPHPASSVCGQSALYTSTPVMGGQSPLLQCGPSNYCSPRSHSLAPGARCGRDCSHLPSAVGTGRAGSSPRPPARGWGPLNVMPPHSATGRPPSLREVVALQTWLGCWRPVRERGTTHTHLQRVTGTAAGSGSAGAGGWEPATRASAAETRRGVPVGPRVKAKALARPDGQSVPALPLTTCLCPPNTSLSLLSLARHGPQGLVSAACQLVVRPGDHGPPRANPACPV